jgi:hypothetical protein
MAKKKLNKVKINLASGVKDVYIHSELMSGYLVSTEKESMKLFLIQKDQVLKD